MAIHIECSECSGQFKVKDDAAGKRVKCPKCSAPIAVPGEVPRSGAADSSERQQRPLAATCPTVPPNIRPSRSTQLAVLAMLAGALLISGGWFYAASVKLRVFPDGSPRGYQIVSFGMAVSQFNGSTKTGAVFLSGSPPKAFLVAVFSIGCVLTASILGLVVSVTAIGWRISRPLAVAAVLLFLILTGSALHGARAVGREPVLVSEAGRDATVEFDGEGIVIRMNGGWVSVNSNEFKERIRWYLIIAAFCSGTTSGLLVGVAYILCKSKWNSRTPASD